MWSTLSQVVCGLLLAVTIAVIPSSSNQPTTTSRCEPITIQMCSNLTYNETTYPNSAALDQDSAGLEVHQFWPLVKVQCSEFLKPFLCSVYSPMCISTFDGPVPPCRSLCQLSQDGCLPLMNMYGFDWPSRLKCDRFPVAGSTAEMCIDENQKIRNGLPVEKKLTSGEKNSSCVANLITTIASALSYWI